MELRHNLLPMTSLHAVRVLWSASIALFASAIVGLKWGAQISIALLPQTQRTYADFDVLHAIWIKRSVLLLLLCAVCGLLGVYLSVRASDAQR
jgi:hypothetical protein